MTKRSRRRPAQCDKNQLGCMWSLFNIFDFRLGRFTRSFLSDRRHGSMRRDADTGCSKTKLKLLTDFDEKNQGIDDGDPSITLKFNNGKTSVKKLMEEDMSCEQHPELLSSAEVEQIQSDSEKKENFQKNHTLTNSTCKVACDINSHECKAFSSLESQESYNPYLMEQSLHNSNLTSLMEEFCSQIHFCQEIHLHQGDEGDSSDLHSSISSVKHNQLDEKLSINEKLIEATEAFLSQKFIDAKQLTKDGAVHQSNQLKDALEMLNSNKELFLKLLQDRNSLLMKHIIDVHDDQAEEVKPTKSLTGVKSAHEEFDNLRPHEELVCRKQFQKKNLHHFFMRKVKSQHRNPSRGSDDPQVLNRIVVLKPVGTQNSAISTSSSFSIQPHDSSRNQGQSRRVESLFSFKEIKKKLKNAMGESSKEQQLISMDGILHKIPGKCQGSGNGGKGITGKNVRRDLPKKTYFNVERTAKSCDCDKRRDKISKPKDCQHIIGNEVALASASSHENLTMTSVGYSKQKESDIYIEAKKHLAEMLSTEEEYDDPSGKQVPRTLGRILSFPEYNPSPIFSSGWNREHNFVTTQKRFSPCENPKQENNIDFPSPLRKNSETPLGIDENYPDIKLVLDSNPDTSMELLPHAKILEGECSARGDISPKGGIEIVELADVVCSEDINNLDVPSKTIPTTPNTSSNQCADTTEIVELADVVCSEDINNLDVPSKTIPTRPNTSSNQCADTTEICKEEGLLECSRLESPKEIHQQPSLDFSLSSSLPSHNIKTLVDEPEWSSPVSVLDTFLLEDGTSPASIMSQPAELPMQPLHIPFDERDSSTSVATPLDREIYLRTCTEDKRSTFEYIRAVLQTSGFSWDDFLGKCHSSNQLLDPSFFDEGDIMLMPNQICGDRKLLFDCINEVLLEVYDCYFGCSPWVSFVKPNIRPAPVGNNILCEVWEGVNWRLIPHFPPCTLDQIIAKDLYKSGIWRDLRFNTEAIGIEMGEIIVEELMEEIVSEYLKSAC